MKTASKRGFTLTEIIISMGIAVVAIGMATDFFTECLRIENSTQQQIKLLGTMRSLSNELIYQASRAHEYVLYNSTTSSDITNNNRKKNVDEYGNDIFPTGDFIVFINYELPKPSSQSRHRIAKLTGYYMRDTADGGKEFVRVIFRPTTPSTDDVETIINANWATAQSGMSVTRKTMADRVNPLALSEATSATPQLFYKQSDTNVAICGQLLSSKARALTNNKYTFTRTFYFSLTVRS